MSHTAILFLSERDRRRAETIGARRYTKCKRYRELKDPIFELLDSAVKWLEEQGFPNPYDGPMLGAFAQLIVQADGKALGHLKDCGLKAFQEGRENEDELFVAIGNLVAEDYLKARRERVPAQSALRRPPRLLETVGTLLGQLKAGGKELAKREVTRKEVNVSFTTDHAEPLALKLIGDAIDRYEQLLPESAGPEGVPDTVEQRAIAKAALMSLHADELRDEMIRQELPRLPTKDAMASALAERYHGELDQVAKIVLDRQEGDPEYGLVTRIMPLIDPPELDQVARALADLSGRYVEPRTAAFYIFGQVQRSGTTLRAHGRIRTFTVNPAEAGGEAQLNFKPFNDQITITLREGERWAEINARRSSDLHIVRAVLARTGEITPAAGVPAPGPLESTPYEDWDSRTLWFLELLRRDLQGAELQLFDTRMAHFLAHKPARADSEPEEVGRSTPPGARAQKRTGEDTDTEPDAEHTPPVREDNQVPVDPRSAADGGASQAAADPLARPRAALDAVRLFGAQLQDHPEACARIVAGARLRDVELTIRHVTDSIHGYARLVRVRLSLEDDHLAVLTGVANAEQDAELHRRLVAMLRAAGRRALDEGALRPTLGRIARRATEVNVEQDEPGVLEDE
jgi:hypothetical protein